MQALSEWVGNIIVLILIAVIMDMLVPNTKLQQYVKMVIGLLLILLLLSPLLTIFSSDKNKIFESIRFEQTISEDHLEKSIKEKKKEIQAKQDAYIEEQMAVQMRKQVEEELMEEYEMNIAQIALDFQKNSDKTYENINAVNVSVTAYDTNEHQTVATIEKVTIGQEKTSSALSSKESPKTNRIREFLSKQWGIDEEKVIVKMEEREKL